MADSQTNIANTFIHRVPAIGASTAQCNLQIIHICTSKTEKTFLKKPHAHVLYSMLKYKFQCKIKNNP